MKNILAFIFIAFMLPSVSFAQQTSNDSLNTGSHPVFNGGSNTENDDPEIINGGPTPINGGPTPINGGPTPINGGPTPINGGPTPINGGPTPINGGPTPINGGLTPDANRDYVTYALYAPKDQIIDKVNPKSPTQLQFKFYDYSRWANVPAGSTYFVQNIYKSENVEFYGAFNLFFSIIYNNGSVEQETIIALQWTNEPCLWSVKDKFAGDQKAQYYSIRIFNKTKNLEVINPIKVCSESNDIITMNLMPIIPGGILPMDFIGYTAAGGRMVPVRAFIPLSVITSYPGN